MDEILYLEPDEEITSVIDKIKNAKAMRLGLVVPRDATLTQSVVNLRLLQREASTLGKEIAVVTTDKIGRNLAAQVGLQVYGSIEEQKPIYQPPVPKPDPNEVIEVDMAPKLNLSSAEVSGVSVHHFQEKEKPVMWRKHQAPVFRPQAQPEKEKADEPMKPHVGNFLAKKQKDFNIFHKIMWPMLAVILILIGAGLYLFLPKATVTITVPSTNLKKDVALSVTTAAKTLNIAQAVVPGQLYEATNEKKGTFTATGQKNVGTKAAGNVTLKNFYPTPYTLNAGAILSSSSKTFVTKSSVTAPGANGPNSPGTASVAIEAQNSGPDSNVKAGVFVIVTPSVNQSWVYAQSGADLSGGTTKQVQVISQSDYDKAKNQLIGDLTTSTTQDLQTKIGKQKVVDKALITPDPIVTSTANVDSQAQNFDMDVKYTLQVMVFDQKIMKDFLVQTIQKQAEANKMVAIASDSDVTYAVTKTAYDKGELDLTTSVNAKIADKIDTTSIKTSILGKSSAQTESIIRSQPNISSVTTDFWPALWFKRIPYLSKNVTINVEYQIK